MLNSIQSIFNASKSKFQIRDYNQYINNLSNNSRNYMKRYSKDQTLMSSQFNRLIDGLLRSFELNYVELEKISDDFNLIDYIQTTISEYGGSLDRFTSLNPYCNIFFDSPDNKECFLIFKNSLPYKYLPIGKDLTQFNSYYPIRLIYTDTEDYSLQIINDHVSLPIMPNEFSVFIIDLYLLLFMWFKYIKIQLKRKKDINRYHFIRNYVFLPLVYQHQDIIIFNYLIKLFKEIIFNIDTNSNEIYDLNIFCISKFNFVNYNIQKIIKNFKEVLKKISDGNMKPFQLLNSVKLPTGITIMELMIYLVDLEKPRNDIQSNWMVFLKDVQYIFFLNYLYSVYKNQQNSVYMKRMLFSIRNTYKSEKFWSYIKDDKLKDLIKNKLFKKFSDMVG